MRSDPSCIVQVQGLGEDHVITADAIREILARKRFAAGKNPPSPALAGLRIRGAWIRGPLNLDGITQEAGGLQLTGCKLDQPLTLRDAAMRWLVLEECVLPGIWADRATVGAFTVKDSLLAGNYAGGTLRLAGAHVTGELRLDGTRVDNPDGPAILAAGLVADSAVFMRTVDARGTGPDGAVCLTGATVAGDLDLSGARLIAGSGPGLSAGNMIVKGAAWLDQGFAATGAGEPGALCLIGASVARQLSLRGATLANGSGPALAADFITVGTSVLIDRDFRAIGAGERAAVQFREAKISGDLLLDGATLANRTGPALAADLITVLGRVSMNDAERPGARFSASGAAGPGTVQFRRARISGPLSLDRALVLASLPDAASRAVPGNGAEDGAVCLSGATVQGDLVLSRASFTSWAGPALMADQLTVGGNAFCCDQGDEDFRATGTGSRGAIHLSDAQITGQLSLRGATLTNASGPALIAESVTVEGDVLLDLGFLATGAGPRATVGLRDAAIGGCLSLDNGSVTSGRPGESAPGTTDGAVHLTGASVGGDLLLRGTSMTSFTGPALRAGRLTVHGDAFRCEQRNEGFRATGSGDDGAVFLVAATMEGQMALSGAVLTNGSGPALMADRATIAGDVSLDEGFTATGGGGPKAAVSLTGATIGRGLVCSGRSASESPDVPGLDLGQARVGSLALSTGFVAAPDSGTALNIDGMTYAGLPVLLSGNPPVQIPGDQQVSEWIFCLQHTAAYSAQAYTALAAAFSQRGDDEAAGRILSAQRDDTRAYPERTGRSRARRSALAILKRLPARTGFEGGQETPGRVLDPVPVTGGEQVEQQPADGRDH